MDTATRKTILRRFASGIYVVTTRHGDEWSAAVVSWLTQCSFAPPLIAMALKRETGIQALFARSGRAVIHAPATNQAELVQSFFGRTIEWNGALNGSPYRLSDDGLPILPAFPAWVVVERRDALARGDHELVTAEVVDAGIEREVEGDVLSMRDTPWSYGG